MKINPAKIKKSTAKLLKKFWQNLFLMMLLLFLLDLIFGWLLLYRYYLKIEETVQIPSPLKINEVLLNQFSSQWVSREEVFRAADEKQYPNPFRSRIPIEQPSEPEEFSGEE